MKVVLKSKEIVEVIPFSIIKKVIYIQDSNILYINEHGACSAIIDGLEIIFTIDQTGLVDLNSIKLK